jgi:hypothetical protein
MLKRSGVHSPINQAISISIPYRLQSQRRRSRAIVIIWSLSGEIFYHLFTESLRLVHTAATKIGSKLDADIRPGQRAPGVSSLLPARGVVLPSLMLYSIAGIRTPVIRQQYSLQGACIEGILSLY